MAIWLVTCSCGRTARLSSHWAAKPAAKLHERLAEGSGAVSSRTPGVPSAADSLRHPPGSPLVEARPAGVGDSESISRPWWAARPARLAPHRDQLAPRSGCLADKTAEKHRQRGDDEGRAWRKHTYLPSLIQSFCWRRFLTISIDNGNFRIRNGLTEAGDSRSGTSSSRRAVDRSGPSRRRAAGRP